MENASIAAAQSKLCQTCGNPFYRLSRVTNAKWESRKYCSVKCQPRVAPQFIPCRICGQPTKYRGNERSRLAGMVRCQSDACKEASRLQKNEAIGAKAKQMYATGERILSSEARKRISEKLSGRKLGNYPAERGQAISKAKKGKPASEAVWRAIRASADARRGKRCDNGLRGYKQTPEHKERIRKAMLGKPQSEEKSRKITLALTGKKLSEQHRQKLAASHKRLWAEGRFTAFRSKLEKRLGEVIEPLGYIPQFRIDGYTHPYDYGHAEKRIVIEVNGCFWHSHGCGVKQCKNNSREKDKANEDFARQNGYQVIVLWQCEESKWPVLLQDAGILRS